MGEIFACEDKSSVETAQGIPLFFVLWWLKESDSSEYNTFTEIDQIKVELKNQISFVFTSKNLSKPDRKLTIKEIKNTKPKEENLNNLEKLDSLNGKNLKDICKIDGSHLSCDSGNYKSKYQQVEFEFYVSNK